MFTYYSSLSSLLPPCGKWCIGIGEHQKYQLMLQATSTLLGGLTVNVKLTQNSKNLYLSANSSRSVYHGEIDTDYIVEIIPTSNDAASPPNLGRILPQIESLICEAIATALINGIPDEYQFLATRSMAGLYVAASTGFSMKTHQIYDLAYRPLVRPTTSVSAIESFVRCCHPRLGADSPLLNVDTSVLQQIAKLVGALPDDLKPLVDILRCETIDELNSMIMLHEMQAQPLRPM